MKQITNMEYEEWQKYKAEKAKGHILLPANDCSAEKQGHQYQRNYLPQVHEYGTWSVFRDLLN